MNDAFCGDGNCPDFVVAHCAFILANVEFFYRSANDGLPNPITWMNGVFFVV
jgi:hypothetical protein